MLTNERGNFDLIGKDFLLKDLNSELNGKAFIANTPIVYGVVGVSSQE